MLITIKLDGGLLGKSLAATSTSLSRSSNIDEESEDEDYYEHIDDDTATHN